MAILRLTYSLNKSNWLIISFVIIQLFLAHDSLADARSREKFVDIYQIIPGVLLDIRYDTPNNFVGTRIDGYLQPKCLLTHKAARALKQVQLDLKRDNLGLKIFDCYRPQMAVDHFVRWAENLKDTKMKTEFYPNVAKKDLFKDGYIAAKSSHSRGSTVDLTLVQFIPGIPMLDMGTPFDFFDPLSHTMSPDITALSRFNRMVLKAAMEKRGFKNLAEEWWHFTLKNEPYPDTYFNFPVE